MLIVLWVWPTGGSSGQTLGGSFGSVSGGEATSKSGTFSAGSSGGTGTDGTTGSTSSQSSGTFTQSRGSGAATTTVGTTGKSDTTATPTPTTTAVGGTTTCVSPLHSLQTLVALTYIALFELLHLHCISKCNTQIIQDVRACCLLAQMPCCIWRDCVDERM
jgi:hypothetical protein